MKRKLPPFPALRAFEAAARLGSFKSASQELCVTPSAISHQVSLLETYLDRPLFKRGAQTVVLTADGQQYLDRVSPVLDELEASTREITGETTQGQLRLKMTEWFAKRWLIPRLPSFMQACPNIEIKIETGLPPTNFRGGNLDAVIHWGDEPVEGAVIEPFFSSTRTPVCSATYLAAHPELRDPQNLTSHVLFRDETSDGWQEWFDTVGLPNLCPDGGPEFSHCELSTNAALAGAGIALSYRELIDDLIEEGQLKQIFDVCSPVRTIYSLAYEKRRAKNSKILAFRDWLFSQILQDSGEKRAA
ncbi:Glycine cleavage system transcriptional activator [Roseovarius litorisediminis]|uniref:Glycine cleavage system transcriptional activator n=1 Tax=Roseovarius litorisediminis TaxID=1312363 RepID=A0A1Y5S0R2_9RHOB|nr:LysR substrate-binding domain-containing protein [Roseovarius litorisediminis]SLN28573.1 Glycine cleavage system transcriptional activator [Roseovarius litorisediminis]